MRVSQRASKAYASPVKASCLLRRAEKGSVVFNNFLTGWERPLFRREHLKSGIFRVPDRMESLCTTVRGACEELGLSFYFNPDMRRIVQDRYLASLDASLPPSRRPRSSSVGASALAFLWRPELPTRRSSSSDSNLPTDVPRSAAGHAPNSCSTAIVMFCLMAVLPPAFNLAYAMLQPARTLAHHWYPCTGQGTAAQLFLCQKAMNAKV